MKYDEVHPIWTMAGPRIPRSAKDPHLIRMEESADGTGPQEDDGAGWGDVYGCGFGDGWDGDEGDGWGEDP